MLAQQIVAAAACRGLARGRPLRAGAARLSAIAICRARDFDAVVEMLSEGIATRRGRSGAYLHRDQVNGVVRGRRGARLAAITSGGAIPDNAQLPRASPSPKGRSSARSTKTSPSRAWPATSSCWAPPPGASAASRPGACAWRTRTARRRPFRSGAAKRPGRTVELSRECRALREAIAAREADADRLADARVRPRPARRRAGRRCTCAPARAALGALPDAHDASSPSASSTKAAACSSCSTRRSARASTAPGAWRCASASAGRSTSSCRPPPPTTAS